MREVQETYSYHTSRMIFLYLRSIRACEVQKTIRIFTSRSAPVTELKKKPRITHVGIYLGNGEIIHSSHMVRINSLIPGTKDYYENAWKLVGAVRL